MAAKKQTSSKTKKPAAKGSSSSKAKRKAREEWEYQRRRFITAIIQFLAAVLFVFIYFMKHY